MLFFLFLVPVPVHVHGQFSRKLSELPWPMRVDLLARARLDKEVKVV
jgi:hypothetical protein